IRGEGRACSHWRLRGVREQAQTLARREPNGGRRPRAQRLPPRLYHETRRLAIAVEGLTKASAAHQRVEEFLVGFNARGARPVLQLGIARREEDLAQALGEQVNLFEEGRLRRDQARDRGSGFAQALGNPAELRRS